MYKVHLLPALFGDSILIEYGQARDPNYILIDGGPFYGYDKLMAGLRRVAPNLKELELLIVTHIDIDHIDGIIKLLNQDPLPIGIKEIWFNGFVQLTSKTVAGSMMGPLQGEYLSMLIEQHKIPHNTSFNNGVTFVNDFSEFPVVAFHGGFEIRLLTPSKTALRNLIVSWEKEVEKIEKKESIEQKWKTETRYRILGGSLLGDQEDDSVSNASSIAFIGSYENKSCLFAGDAPTAELLPGIQSLLAKSGQKRLKLDGWKLAHHGSQRSTSEELVKLIDARHIMVSTDGARYHLPDKECIESVISLSEPGTQLHFNYQSDENIFWVNENAFYTAHYPKEHSGITIQF